MSLLLPPETTEQTAEQSVLLRLLLEGVAPGVQIMLGGLKKIGEELYYNFR